MKKDKIKKILAIGIPAILIIGFLVLYNIANPYKKTDGKYETVMTKNEMSKDVVELTIEKPEMILAKWDKEVQMSVSYDKVQGGGNRDLFSDRIEWEGNKENVVAYPLPAKAQMESGGFEFEVVLKEKPATNIFEFKIEGTENLDFFYQGPLTPQQIAEGVERPENVVGSYAVYHKAKKDNQYQTGKAFHIFRPKVIGADGKEMWAELRYNPTNGILAVVVPQEFLDSAVYPVVVDPTFGYTTAGGSSAATAANRWYASTGTPASSGTVDSVSMYAKLLSAGSENFKAVITNSSGTILTDGVGGTATVNSTSGAWYTANYSSKPSIVASTAYWIGAVMQNTSVAIQFYFDDAGANPYAAYDTSNNYTTPTNPTDLATQNRYYSFYATYTNPTPGSVKIYSKAGTPDSWYSSSWNYRKKITIDNQKVASTTGPNITNFPMLFSVTDSELKFTSFGGKVASSTSGDILFTLGNGTTALNYEIEKYASTTGELVAWIQIPFLSSTSTTPIYMYLGNPSAPTPAASTAQNVWDSNYVGVYHFPNGSTLSPNDSTSNGYNLTNNGSVGAGTGKIDGAATGFTSPKYLTSPAITTITSALTISYWVKATSNSNYQIGFSGSGTGPELWAYDNGAGGLMAYLQNNGVYTSTFYPVDNTWHYLVSSYNGAGVILYGDGNQVRSYTSVSTQNMSSFTVGRRAGTDNYYINGSMDEVRVSKIGRSADWITTEYNNQSNPTSFYTYGGLETQNGRVNSAGTSMPAVKARGGVKFR